MFLLLVAGGAFCQFFQTGTEPFRTRWRKVSAKGINLIYPTDAEQQAQDYIRSLAVADSVVGLDYNLPPSRIDVVLHNRNVLSNGYVAWAPRRMELITFHGGGIGAQMWHDMLSVHEMRHVKQMNNLQRGVFRALWYVIGEQAIGLAASLVPMWYLEGDAVYAETKYSRAGRGREATFYQHYRAHLLEGKKHFRYDKWLNGSYRDYIPNHYSFGYQMVDYTTSRFGFDAWRGTLSYVTRLPITLFPFYFGLKKETGLSRRQLSNAMFAARDSMWRATLDSTSTATEVVSARTSTYTNYLYPFKSPSGKVLCLRKSLSRPPAFVELGELGKERLIAQPGVLIGDPYIDDSLIVWSEYQAHIRWEQKSYGRVIMLNMESGVRAVFPQRGMFWSPVYFKPLGAVVALCYAPNGSVSLQQLDMNGEATILHTFDGGSIAQAIKTDGRDIYALATTSRGKQVVRVGLNGASEEVVLPPVFADISSIHIAGGDIYFSATEQFVENIYCYNMQQGVAYKVVSTPYGSRYPFVDSEGKMLFSSYSAAGYAVSSAPIHRAIPIELGQIRAAVSDSISAAQPNEEAYPKPAITYKPEKYNEAAHLVNIHSWAPFFYKPTQMVAGTYSGSIGATAMSQNLTGTMLMSAGYGYEPHSAYKHVFNATVQYRGWFPVIAASFDLEPFAASLYNVIPTDYQPNRQRQSLQLKVMLPLQLSTGRYVTQLVASSSLSHSNDYIFYSGSNRYKMGISYVDNELYFRTISRMAHRDIYPRYGAVLHLNHVFAPTSTIEIGGLLSAVSVFYLPGIATNHSVVLKASYQHQLGRGGYMNNRVQFPRGYNPQLVDDFIGTQVNYTLPLFYPDWNIGALMYIKRFSLNMFADYARTSTISTSSNLQVVDNLNSFGYELSANFHLLRTRFPFRFIYRMSWLKGECKPVSWFDINFDVY